MKYGRLPATALSNCLLVALFSSPATHPHPGPQGPDLIAAAEDEESVEVIDELHRACWIQQVLREKLLTPAPELEARFEDVLAQFGDDGGMVRMMRMRDEVDGVLDALDLDGGGAYYSFATREHDYQKEAALSCCDGYFSSGFHGGARGVVVPIGELEISSLPLSVEPVPASWSPDLQTSWMSLWTEQDASHPGFPRGAKFPARANRQRDGLKIGQSYILRSIHLDGHDDLIAFQHVASDRFGVTLLWRRLKAFAPPARLQFKSPVERLVPAPDEATLGELHGMGAEQLLAELKRTRDWLEPAFFWVPEDHRTAYEIRMGQVTPQGAHGMCRIYRRGLLSPLINRRYGGGSVTFGEYEEPFLWEEDALLSAQGHLQSLGHVDVALDLGPLEDDELQRAIQGINPLANGDEHDGWNFIRSLRPTIARERIRLSQAERQHALHLEHRLAGDLRVRPGYSYLLRKAGSRVTRVQDGTTTETVDRTTLVTVVAADDYGATLAWHRLP
ncbi:hypothetical protein Poly30_13930 [Planctomycetes bacterium Poly30]|uniref:Uncharacterized protein n=1 Tax=Saltatorellus ferox TaxID=2528018 RepID=A0A518EP76_9BACT|nr:hypothetical protein Poly30_13930 [Planctomycetes bacterium Poly30]